MIILDLFKFTVERFEPHGAHTGSGLEKISIKTDEVLKNFFEKLITDFKFEYIPPMKICPYFTKDMINKLSKENEKLNYLEGRQIGLQSFENRERSGDSGYCVAWSLFYLDSRLSAPSKTPQQLYNHIFDKLKTDPKQFLKFIRGYAKFLGEFYEKIINEFILKYPIYKNKELLLYTGKDRKKILNRNKIYRNNKTIYKKIIDDFDDFINDMLIDVAGDGKI